MTTLQSSSAESDRTTMESSHLHHQPQEHHEKEEHEAGSEGEKLWQAFSDSFKEVQVVLDQNRVLITQVNENHQSKLPDNITKNVALIKEINGNISKVVSLYSELANNFNKVLGKHNKVNRRSPPSAST